MDVRVIPETLTYTVWEFHFLNGEVSQVAMLDGDVCDELSDRFDVIYAERAEPKRRAEHITIPKTSSLLWWTTFAVVMAKAAPGESAVEKVLARRQQARAEILAGNPPAANATS